MAKYLHTEGLCIIQYPKGKDGNYGYQKIQKGYIVLFVQNLKIWFIFFVGMIGIFPARGYALEPHEILVLANRNARSSVGLGRYYMEKRGIPEENLLQLWITDKEWCSREEFDKKAAGPVRKHLRERHPLKRIRCLVAMYGVPLKISPPVLTPAEKKEVEDFTRQRAESSRELEKSREEKAGDEKEIVKKMEDLNRRIQQIQKDDQRSSFDSEIALVLKEAYPLSGWLPNPFFVGLRGKEVSLKRDEVLMTARLDGPSEVTVRRIIDDAIAVEKTGLQGTAYFDARWPRPTEEQTGKMNMGYGFYDWSIHLAAGQVQKSGRMPVVVNDKEELFREGDCPDAALYCGWYSLARYVDAFQWRPGAVGYHIASAECETLKNKNSQVWCKRMLEDGVAATIGPVGEPYVQAFPVPEIFFGLLLDGFWTLAECYALSQPFWSWQMVLIGDPLYRPFQNSGR